MKKRSVALLLAATMAMTALVGCGGNETPVANNESSEVSSETNAVETEAPEEFSYPVAEGGTLTYWGELTSTVAAYYSSLAETPFAKGWQEETGITVEFQHPASGQTDEQFSLIMTDEVLPDLMEYNWAGKYSGGPEKAIKDGVIIPLNDVFEQYCPNLMAYLEEHPEIDKMIKTDDGTYYVFPFIRGDDRLLNTVGLMLRKDWLDELGKEVPTTIDEWHDVLTAFKEKGVVSPLSWEYTSATYKTADPFVAAFETSRAFYIGDDGKVHFGATEDNFKDYLTIMNQWYSEGLIDADLASLKNAQVSAKMTSGEAGASMGQAGSRMGTWTTAARATTPEFELVAAPVPTLTEGETAEFGYHELYYSGKSSVAITTSCENVELAARLLDWAYSEEGHMYFNFGTEGVSYEMVNGYPTYTDEIMNNPDGLPIANAMSSYIRGNYNGPFVQDYRYLEQYYTMPEQLETPVVWGDNNGAAHIMPPVTPTADESKEYSTIMTEIEAHRDEQILKFIFGDRSLDEFDDYVKEIEDMGLARALEIQNAALDRYNAR